MLNETVRQLSCYPCRIRAKAVLFLASSKCCRDGCTNEVVTVVGAVIEAAITVCVHITVAELCQNRFVFVCECRPKQTQQNSSARRSLTVKMSIRSVLDFLDAIPFLFSW